MDLPEVPPKHRELIELEQRQRALRAQRAEIEDQLKQIEDIAEQLADGRLTELSTSDLPAQRQDLEKRAETLARASRKAQQKIVREREQHNKQIVRAFRPAHKAAARRIMRAVEELISANAAELEIRQKCPVPLVSVNFPNIGDFGPNRVGIARHWRDYVSRLGFLEPDEPEPATKPKRGLFAGRGNGAEPAPLAAKSAD